MAPHVGAILVVVLRSTFRTLRYGIMVASYVKIRRHYLYFDSEDPTITRPYIVALDASPQYDTKPIKIVLCTRKPAPWTGSFVFPFRH